MDKRALGFRQLGSRNAGDERAPGGHGRRLPRSNGGGQPQRVRNPLLIPLDNALAAGRLETAAELGGFFGGTKRPNHRAVINAFLAEISTPDHR